MFSLQYWPPYRRQPLRTDYEIEEDTVVFHIPVRLKRRDIATIISESPKSKLICHFDTRSRTLLEVAKDLLAYEHMRTNIPGLEGLLGDPSWQILLDLFVREGDGKATTVTSATIASGAPMTTALRYLTILGSIGFVIRRPHPHDERSVLLSLSNNARAAICNVLKNAR